MPEVQIEAARKKKEYKSVYYDEPDFSLSEEKIRNIGVTHVKDLFYAVPGVWVVGNKIMIRGINSLSGGGAPLILIDGVDIMEADGGQSNIGFLNMLSISDIGQIDVLKDGASLTIFGSKGMYGVINIHTKRGEPLSYFQPDNIKSVTPLGYQLPIEFYSPKYDIHENLNNPKPDLRTTVYWKPNVLTDGEGNARLSFYTADDPVTYTVIIQGVSEDGKLINYCREGVIRVE